jgi:2-hydroxychromene-2-carboxylate isomerase
MAQVEFHFDVGSPNAYFCHVRIPAIEARTGAQFVYVPVLLGGIFKLTNNQAPMVAFGGVRNKLAYQQVEIDRYVRRHGISGYRFNPHFPVNTLLVMRAAIAAEMDGVLPAYADAIFRAMWEDGLKMDDATVAAGVLSAAGLDAARLLGRAGEQEVKDKLAANTAASVERGSFGSPTFFVDGEMYFGKDRLDEVEETLLQK